MTAHPHLPRVDDAPMTAMERGSNRTSTPCGGSEGVSSVTVLFSQPGKIPTDFFSGTGHSIYSGGNDVRLCLCLCHGVPLDHLL